ncbi:uncharacterized protein BKA78DRAFT_145277 [Phyllosticta capitalensis]|uniref:uncharacterized protein n=1 Tax=Phyllosticta capitalensis TaxID=121624 RepID=UPI0031322A09
MYRGTLSTYHSLHACTCGGAQPADNERHDDDANQCLVAHLCCARRVKRDAASSPLPRQANKQASMQPTSSRSVSSSSRVPCVAGARDVHLHAAFAEQQGGGGNFAKEVEVERRSSSQKSKGKDTAARGAASMRGGQLGGQHKRNAQEKETKENASPTKGVVLLTKLTWREMKWPETKRRGDGQKYLQ